jgi:hypothetical protein
MQLWWSHMITTKILIGSESAVKMLKNTPWNRKSISIQADPLVLLSHNWNQLTKTRIFQFLKLRKPKFLETALKILEMLWKEMMISRSQRNQLKNQVSITKVKQQLKMKMGKLSKSFMTLSWSATMTRRLTPITRWTSEWLSIIIVNFIRFLNERSVNFRYPLSNEQQTVKKVHHLFSLSRQ